MSTRLTILLCLMTGLAGAADFNRDVRPILASKCFACHGPDDEKREADLRLDIPNGGFDGTKILERITTTDPEDVMPPPKSPKPLTSSELATLREWIKEGAKYQAHWAFEPIKRPIVPSSNQADPQAQASNLKAQSTANPIDAFIHAELAKHHLTPAPEADPATLVRRLYLDLIGLPPEPDEAANFVAQWNSTSSPGIRHSTFERLVDRLLASPQFGERWGRHWLDMARYADSNGFLGDGLRPNAYRYRDWVIQAFNSDMPYDEFTVAQIAGDLLENREPTTENRELVPGTGFHRNAALNTEAGVDKEEASYQNLVDRVNTVGRVWLGLTIGCAQCHTHKYDPITIRDYYSFYAFFDNTEDREDAKTKAPLLAEISKDRRQTYVHLAGDYTRHGPDVMPVTLSALPTPSGPTRLELAKWLVSPRNPLTARVAVNHIWSKLFGYGLVRTPDDFGTSGESPSHPELLDWLATEFMRNGWSRKQLIKRIMMSETYRQASHHSSGQSPELDPLNKLLSRQNRIRLDAEVLRDSALAVSGLLKPTIGGPSFRPPLPEDVFDVGRSSNWKASPGDEIYRRSLYIITLRSVLYPTLTTFDAPDAADACVRRERSNTPLQALTMMNDGVFVEAAQALALRVMRESSIKPSDRLLFLFERVLNRAPRPEEVQRLKTFYDEQRSRVEAGGADALKALGGIDGSVTAGDKIEAATLVATARVLMNLDEFINRE